MRGGLRIGYALPRSWEAFFDMNIDLLSSETCTQMEKKSRYFIDICCTENRTHKLGHNLRYVPVDKTLAIKRMASTTQHNLHLQNLKWSTCGDDRKLKDLTILPIFFCSATNNSIDFWHRYTLLHLICHTIFHPQAFKCDTLVLNLHGFQVHFFGNKQLGLCWLLVLGLLCLKLP